VIGHEERIYLKIVLTHDVRYNDGDHPNDPYHILDLISPSALRRLVITHANTFLDSACRTEISAPDSSQKHRQDEHRYENYETAVRDMFSSRHQYQIRREIPNRNREQQKSEYQKCLPNFLSHKSEVSSFMYHFDISI